MGRWVGDGGRAQRKSQIARAMMPLPAASTACPRLHRCATHAGSLPFFLSGAGRTCERACKVDLTDSVHRAQLSHTASLLPHPSCLLHNCNTHYLPPLYIAHVAHCLFPHVLAQFDGPQLQPEHEQHHRPASPPCLQELERHGLLLRELPLRPTAHNPPRLVCIPPRHGRPLPDNRHDALEFLVELSRSAPVQHHSMLAILILCERSLCDAHCSFGTAVFTTPPHQ